MLVLLNPQEIARNLDIIEAMFLNSMPPLCLGAEGFLVKVRESILSKKMAVWWEMDENGNCSGQVITTIRHDGYTDIDDLVVYSLYATKTVPIDVWLRGLATLRVAAKKSGCKRVVGYTNVPEIVARAKKLGADTSFTFVTMEVDDAPTVSEG